jgi:hypothetical protein
MKKQKATIIVLVIAVGWLCMAVAHSNTDQNVPVNSEGERFYDVAAFVWPSYHPDDRAKIFWPMGIGECETVMKNEAKFEGHDQPRMPVWGYINEADRYVMAMEIEAAADHGVNVFIFDWYWYDGMPYLEGCLNNGYLRAKNNHRVRFYLMWANHDVNLIWDKRNADDAFENNNKALIWKGGIERDEFEKICHRFIEKYFAHPSYYKIDGKPVFMIFDLHNFVKGLGGIEQAQDASEWLRNETKKAGFEGLELQCVMHKDGSGKTAFGRDKNALTQKEVIEKLGFDSLTHYQIVQMTNVDRDYNEAMKDVALMWNRISDSYSADYYPHVSVGWDTSPRAFRFKGPIVKNNTPENFEKALILARNFVDAHPDQAPLVIINSWNEWTETSYLQPCKKYGYGYLESVRRVFKVK